jgi:hypothetical protein
MCRDLISPDLEAWLYNGRVFCSTDCAVEAVKEDLKNSPPAWYQQPLKFRSEDEFNDWIGDQIKLCEEVIDLSTPLYCGDELEVMP